MGEETNI